MCNKWVENGFYISFYQYLNQKSITILRSLYNFIIRMCRIQNIDSYIIRIKLDSLFFIKHITVLF